MKLSRGLVPCPLRCYVASRPKPPPPQNLPFVPSLLEAMPCEPILWHLLHSPRSLPCANSTPSSRRPPGAGPVLSILAGLLSARHLLSPHQGRRCGVCLVKSNWRPRIDGLTGGDAQFSASAGPVTGRAQPRTQDGSSCARPSRGSILASVH